MVRFVIVIYICQYVHNLYACTTYVYIYKYVNIAKYVLCTSTRFFYRIFCKGGIRFYVFLNMYSLLWFPLCFHV